LWESFENIIYVVCGGDCKKCKILNIVPGMQGRLFLIRTADISYQIK
jgi:hypothetical protein